MEPKDLSRALADIADIRRRVAAGALFRGLGSMVVAGTGALAIAAAAAQLLAPETLGGDPISFVVYWTAAAVAAVGLVLGGMALRALREDGAMTMAMIGAAIESFAPAAVAGAAVTAAFFATAPEQSWMLPGLWQCFIATGVFAARDGLPDGARWVAFWYLFAGIGAFVVAAGRQELAPLAMGIGFGVGQLLFAGVLRLAEREAR